ncbi:hypothetical protein [Pseudarthrobacter sp. TAF60_1]|uniref:hypothetical protein n=1 Tax=Pseudarthrobacter sp. TAF60_1 TaxID=3233071 RepID=UPI003F9C3019
MIRSSSAPGGVAAAAITVLALTAGLSAAAPAQADNGATGPGCEVVCGLLPSDQKTQPSSPGTGKPTGPPSATPSPPPPAAPAPAPAPTTRPVPAVPAPAPVPTFAPEPMVSPVQETPTPEATTSIAPSAASASPSAESNWDTPVTKSARPTQAAAVSRNDGTGLLGGPGLLPIMAGVLLVGVAGLAFAWWGRNRFSAH